MSQIDQSALDKIRDLQREDSPDLLARIICIFCDQTVDSIDALLAAIDINDFDMIGQSAHSVKSSAAYVGAAEFSNRLASIEKSAKDQDIASCQQMALGLKEHCSEVIDELINLKDKAA